MPELLQVAFLLALVYGFSALHRIASAAEAGKFQLNVNYIKNGYLNGCSITQEAADAD